MVLAWLHLREMRFLVAGAAALLTAAAAHAVTLTDLRGAGFDAQFGRYAPGGDCKREPMLIIDETGLTFHAGGRDMHGRSIEYAASYLGPDYEGNSRVLFPFPTSEDEPGPVLMTLNADEKPGVITFEDNRGPGERFTPLEAALIAVSPLMLCSRA